MCYIPAVFSDPAVTEPRARVGRTPAWVQVLDGVTIGLLIVALAVAVFGGARWRILDVRISLVVWWRPVVAALAVFALRHLVARHPPLHRRVADGIGRLRERLPASAGGRLHLAARLAVVALVVQFVAGAYRPGTGFTSLIAFGGAFEAQVTPALRDVPHAVVGIDQAGYDGQFYAQMALDPLLRDRAIDTALDTPAYRARRALFSWTAYVLGLGQPAWVLEAYALQNVLAWLIFAWGLSRWFPVATPRSFVPWVGCVLGAGIASSVKFALLDGLGMLVLMLAVIAIERRRHVLATGWLAVACLGRETSVLGGAVLVDRLPRSGRAVAALALAGATIIVPLVVWQAYLRTLGPAFVGTSDVGRNFAVPFSGFVEAWQVTLADLAAAGWSATPSRFSLLELVGITVQAAYLVLRPAWTQPWWRLGAAYVVLMALLGTAVWEGSPGAFVRVLLPLTFAFNVLVTQSRWFWPLAILGNLSVYHGLEMFRVPWLWPYL